MTVSTASTQDCAMIVFSSLERLRVSAIKLKVPRASQEIGVREKCEAGNFPYGLAKSAILFVRMVVIKNVSLRGTRPR